MDINKVKLLITLLEESSVAEIEIYEGPESIRISRALTMLSQTTLKPGCFAAASGKSIPILGEQVIPSVPDVTESVPLQTDDYILRSPMVGTFFITPNPESKAFCEVGQKVNVGDTLCIVKAMKMMNKIEADKSGVVKTILIKSGQPVEYDEPLFVIEQGGKDAG